VAIKVGETVRKRDVHIFGTYLQGSCKEIQMNHTSMEIVMDSPQNSQHSVLSLFTKKKRKEKGKFIFQFEKILFCRSRTEINRKNVGV